MQNIKLYRITIKEAARLGARINSWPNDTHLIFIECTIEGVRFNTNYVSLCPNQLKSVYKYMIDEILAEYKNLKNQTP